MADDFCPRQVTFLLDGAPSVRVTATETGAGAINFVVDVEDNSDSTADLRGLFFQFNEAKLAGLTVTSSDPLVTDSRIAANNVIDLGQGATLAGFAQPFDVGVEFGTPGSYFDLVDNPVSFTLSNGANNLTLDDLAGMQFGARLDAVIGDGKRAGGAIKLLGSAPAAPDAKDDTVNIFEDGASGLNDPSKTPHAVTLDVLANDTDADTPHGNLVITELHDGPSHGVATIAADGKSILYTPTGDYSGSDSFEYCMSDGAGGQDSAVCTVNVAAVADKPLITFNVTPTSDVNEFLVTATANQNDADASETIDSLVVANAGSLPAGVSVSAGTVDPSSTPGHLVETYTVTTAAQTDYNFNLDFTATSKEASNADTETETKSKAVDINFTHSQDGLTYTVANQSIWDTGDEFQFHDERFLGLNKTISGSGGDPDVTSTDYDFSLHVKAGFQSLIDLNGGDIDASIPVDVTLDTTYNKTTDQLLINPAAVLGSGLSFTTHSPSGEIKLDFVFQADGHVFAEILGVDLIDKTFDFGKTINILDLNSSSAHFSWDVLPGIVKLDFDFPQVTTTNSGGANTSSGEDAFLTATVDVDQAANQLLGGLLSFIDSDPLDDSNFEVLDADLIGALKLVQKFAVNLASQTVTLVFDEDNTTQTLDLTKPLLLDGASVHDVNHDGTIAMHFDFTPHVTLTNQTDVKGDLSFYLAFLKNTPGGIGTVWDDTFPIADASFNVYTNTFDLAGLGSQLVSFAA